ncbi:Undecaprenyl phosphate-alpha-4-amino-4-deoxy-L-arabinose arabinosyl transferase [Paraburkholderia fynbosensis]|uniref:Undecaprenyl phosphate-alpha-4-amino-4-deoxy-L-arabinose arabinosyl transferase n=1 Tax=Paraburkholderia fynbosensis TaxID=1200993 RepID=A0A6J5GU05_9BURK|nr:Undecaprenyl phosphate-alpha-4-amino-4-deoxy-L-arabinose arabinosyl transferase [Paraburkholderia fynbosensis]
MPGSAWSKWFQSRMRRVWRVAIVVISLSLYLVPGIVGREPWKQDETYTFGIIQHMAKSGDWIVPTNAGVPFMEKPPLFYWIATGLMRASSGSLRPADGARLATLLSMLITFAAVAATARVISGGARWDTRDVTGALLLLAGTIGLVKHAHDLFTDVGQMGASAVALYALTKIVLIVDDSSPGRLWVASSLLGISTAATFMTKGLLMPGVLGSSACIVPSLVRSCRSRRYMAALLIAGGVALPLMFIWPWLLAERSTSLFETWFWDNNVGRFLGFSVPELGSDNTLSTSLKALFFFAFPVGPLALTTITRAASWRQPGLIVAALVTCTGLVTLCLSATMRELYLLPLLPALTPLGADALPRLPLALQRAWAGLASMVAVVCLSIVWSAWWIMRGPVGQHHWLAPLHRWLPLEYELPARQPVAVLTALALTMAWIAAQRSIARSGSLRGAASWAAALTLGWGLAATLVLPWIDDAKSYRVVFEHAAHAMTTTVPSGGCVTSDGFGESEAPMFEFYTKRQVVGAGTSDSWRCRILVVQTPSATAPARPTWKPFWSGSRPGDSQEHFFLYQKADNQHFD